MSTRKLRLLAFPGTLVIIGITLISGCGGRPTEAPGGEALAPEETPPSYLSEQPDKRTFSEYFSDIGLGKLPAGEKLPEGLQRDITVFAPGDSICVYGTLIREVRLSLAIYDTVAKEFASPKSTLPQALQQGGFTSCSTTNLAAGKYEYKVYVGDTLVAVLPFEVHE